MEAGLFRDVLAFVLVLVGFRGFEVVRGGSRVRGRPRWSRGLSYTTRLPIVEVEFEIKKTIWKPFVAFKNHDMLALFCALCYALRWGFIPGFMLHVMLGWGVGESVGQSESVGRGAGVRRVTARIYLFMQRCA